MDKGSRRRIAGVTAASWVLATVVTSFVVWQAVAVFNDGASTNVLTAPQVAERLEAAKATKATPTAATSTTTPTSKTPTPSEASPTSDDTPATTSPASATASPRTRASSKSSAPVTVAPPQSGASPVVKTWTVTGGTVSVSCQAQAITLLYASPQDGWRFETEKGENDRIDVTFRTVGQGTELSATCVNGIPQQTTQANDGDH